MNSIKIPFNKPYLSGKETEYIIEAVHSGKISGNGLFTKKCHYFFEEKYKFRKVLLTTSCTDALEMAALLANIGPDDEVIIPAYTFVSTALAFVRQGAKVVFVDSCADHPNVDASLIEALITPRTKAIAVVHYAGMACDMDAIMQIAETYNLLVIEDAAQAIDSYYKGRPLGSIGHLAAFSFHETKNIISGEGGMLVVNDERFVNRSEIIWEKGTNRSEFFRGEVNKYGWVDIGSSFLPSEVISAYLYAQLENLEKIQRRRMELWNYYFDALQPIVADGHFKLPLLPEYATNNAHILYIVCNSSSDRSKLINALEKEGILAVFHYLSLHKSKYYKDKSEYKELIYSDYYSDCLLRLPMFYELTYPEIDKIVRIISQFYAYRKNAQTIYYNY